MPINLVSGCVIRWTESVFTPYIEGEVPDFIGERTVKGIIQKEGYSLKSGKHFFTIKVHTCSGVGASEIKFGDLILRRGRVIYQQCEVLQLPRTYDKLVEDKIKRKIKNVAQVFGKTYTHTQHQ